MAHSLLAHLYSHIRGSQEDIATLSLQYILSQSNELNDSFVQLIGSSLHATIDEPLHFICQSCGDEKERPDLAGLSASGHEKILGEVKFYAALTENQPLTYLRRLKKEKGIGLIFICPQARKSNLWGHLLRLCAEESVEIISSNCAQINGVPMAIVSWAEVLNDLHRTAAAKAPLSLSDIEQLQGYCAQMDSDAFVPFTNEDFGCDIAKNIERYYQVIDETIQLLYADDTLSPSLKGVKATAYRKGYTRSISIRNFKITINYDRDLWRDQRTDETPFWVAIRNEDWTQNEALNKKFLQFSDAQKENFWNLTFLALYPLTNCTLQEIAEDFKKQILNYIEAMK